MNCNIEAERARLQLTKEDLAAKLGVTSKTYLSYVRGDTAIPSDILLKMAALFHCTTDYLLGFYQEDSTYDQVVISTKDRRVHDS